MAGFGLDIWAVLRIIAWRYVIGNDKGTNYQEGFLNG
jgi:hypothetical protein